MKLILLKNNITIQNIDLTSKDPLTLLSYYEILLRCPNPMFCLLICQTTRFVYLAKDIIEMRYGFEGHVSVYLLKDPMSRETVKDIWYFEVRQNHVYENQESKVSSDVRTFKHSKNEQTICAEFVSNEMNVFNDDTLRYKILGHKKKDRGAMYLILYTIFVILVIVFCWYMYKLIS